MLFNRKKKDMVDIRELQKRGVVRIPKRNINIPTTPEGFVELGSTQEEPSIKSTTSKTQSNAGFFGFMGDSTPTTDHRLPTTDSPGGYDKREVDEKVTNLDNKIYKLEQRIELLEKKLDVNQSDNNVGAMGW